MEESQEEKADEARGRACPQEEERQGGEEEVGPQKGKKGPPKPAGDKEVRGPVGEPQDERGQKQEATR
ncbi:hypothetical protein TJA_20740 [Thermus sp. LT1-2-5]